MVLISVFPTAFFFFAPFTESLFLATAVWASSAPGDGCWRLAHRRPARRADPDPGRVPDPAAGLGGHRLLARAGAVGERVVHGRPWARSCGRPSPRWPRRSGFVAFLAYSSSVAGQTPLDTQEPWGGKSFHPPWDVVEARPGVGRRAPDPLQALNLATLLLFAVVTCSRAASGADLVLALRDPPDHPHRNPDPADATDLDRHATC